ncbi:MAG: hypothetical protein Q8M43_01845 [Sulfuricurvum sp.]|uniref:CC0125/CC1285 family lipoprotein n=1 Tax=Sulfuricurvum sp. TaxID=2025608 RepID=UPI0027344BB8|nr:hypothetical protein [Sulfuricurvum sp.]MDP3290752.1 hypothetical protein [Sulfuricurvum sp.]
MRVIAILLVILFLGGCATAYQPQSFSGGFSETQLDTNVFTITFKGNGYTGRDKANDFALLRSAELALEHGFKYFAIVDAQQYSKNSTYTTPTTATTNVNANTYGSAYSYGNNTTYNGNTYGTATTTVSGGETYNISKPRTSNTIVCFVEKPQSFTYNAEFLVKSLKQKYRIDNTPNK